MKLDAWDRFVSFRWRDALLFLPWWGVFAAMCQEPTGTELVLWPALSAGPIGIYLLLERWVVADADASIAK